MRYYGISEPTAERSHVAPLGVSDQQLTLFDQFKNGHVADAVHCLQEFQQTVGLHAHSLQDAP